MKPTFNEKVNEKTAQELADDMTKVGAKLTYGLTLPIFLIVLGYLFLPWGFLLWFVAAILFISSFAPPVLTDVTERQKENSDSK